MKQLRIPTKQYQKIQIRRQQTKYNWCTTHNTVITVTNETINIPFNMIEIGSIPRYRRIINLSI